MAFQPAPGIALVEMRGVLHGQRVENTLHFRAAGTISQESLQLLVNAIGDLVGDEEYLAYWPNEFQWTEIYARDLTTAIGAQATDATVAGLTGAAGAGMPGNVTLAITLRTGLTGRSARGRVYWMGITEGSVVGNAINPAVAAGFVDVLEDIRAAALAVGWELVVLSRQQAGVVLASAIGYDVTTIGVSDLNTDSQRGRLTGRGN